MSISKAVERSMSPADGIAETDSISRNSASVAENNLSSQLTELTVADSQADTKGENGCEATNDNMDSEIKSNESSNVDQVVSETKIELHTSSSGRIIKALFEFLLILSLLRSTYCQTKK